MSFYELNSNFIASWNSWNDFDPSGFKYSFGSFIWLVVYESLESILWPILMHCVQLNCFKWLQLFLHYLYIRNGQLSFFLWQCFGYCSRSASYGVASEQLPILVFSIFCSPYHSTLTHKHTLVHDFCPVLTQYRHPGPSNLSCIEQESWTGRQRYICRPSKVFQKILKILTRADKQKLFIVQRVQFIFFYMNILFYLANHIQLYK